MASTIGGVIRDIIIADGLCNNRVWADDAPDRATYPYITINDAISVSPTLKGDQSTIMLGRIVQVDLWEQKTREDLTVARHLYSLLDGARAPINGSTVTRVSIDDAQRFVEDQTNIVHLAFTLSVKHDPTAF